MTTEGAFLIIADPPSKLEFGIDCMDYVTGNKFRGVSIIPPGIHFVYYSTHMGARQGFFIDVKVGDIVVRSWDAYVEDITSSNILSENANASLINCLGRGELNGQLGPYPFSQHHLWLNLSGFITGDTLLRAKCLPSETNKPHESITLYPGDLDIPSLAYLSSSDSVPECQACFCNIELAEKEVWQIWLEKHGVSCDPVTKGKVLTDLHMDKTQVLEYLITIHFQGTANELLGELQLSFVLFLLLYSMPSLQHWKKVVAMICTCEIYLLKSPTFCASFIRLLYHQLQYAPTDFFEVELSKENFLAPSLSNLMTILTNADVQLNANVEEHRKRLLLFLKKKFSLFDHVPMSPVSGPKEEGMDGPARSDGLTDWFAIAEQDRPVIVYDVKEQEPSIDHVSDGDVVVDASEPLDPAGGHGNAGQRHVTTWSTFDAMLEVEPMPSASRSFVASSESHRCTGHEPRREDEMSTGIIDLNTVPVRGSTVPDSGSTGMEIDEVGDTPISALSRRNKQKELDLFGWRYPLLSAEVRVEEDLMMAASRLLAGSSSEESQDINMTDPLMIEIVQFIERESQFV